MTPILLSQLGKIVTGKTPKTSREDFFGGSTPFVTPSDMDQQRTISKTARTLSKDGVTSVKNSVIPAGAVMVSCIGSDMGKTYISGARSVTNQQINSLIVTDERASPLFIYYNLFGRRVEIREKAAGAAQPILNKTEFGKIVVDLPEIEEQSEIAAILGALDDKIELNRKTAATLEEMARALYRSWFVDFDPVHARSQGLPPAHMPPTTAALFPDSFGDDGLPEGWRTAPIGELIADTIGGDWGKEAAEGSNIEPIAIIRGTDFPGLKSGTVAGVPTRFTSVKKAERRELLPWDVVLEISGGSPTQSTGRSLLVTDTILERFNSRLVPASFCRRLRPVNKESGIFSYLHIDQLYRNEGMWAYQNQSTGISNFQTPRFLKEELVILPPDNILAEFAEQVSPLLKRISTNENQSLTTLRDTLLPRLMSGELRVGDARDQIKEAL